MSRITPAQADAIRCDPRSCDELAVVYGVHRDTVRRVRTGQSRHDHPGLSPSCVRVLRILARFAGGLTLDELIRHARRSSAVVREALRELRSRRAVVRQRHPWMPGLNDRPQRRVYIHSITAQGLAMVQR